MQIFEHHSLRHHNSFGIDAQAELFAECQSLDDLFALRENPQFANRDKLILGGGSNVLLVEPTISRVVHVALQGRECIDENTDTVLVRLAAGENWHSCVEWCVSQGFHGIENLALIPGSVGAAPIQNIGAYGIELSDVVERVWYVDESHDSPQYLTSAQCQFGYRDSIFKRELRGKACISAVELRLKKLGAVDTSYRDLAEELRARGVTDATLSDVFNAVIRVRQRKLPDPHVLPNAGSFFKNPYVESAKAESLREQFPTMPLFDTDNPSVKKLSAAWLIDSCGWKGYRKGDAGVYEKHALVLVNYQLASGAELYALAGNIQDSVRERFGVSLEIEVNVIR